MILSGPSLGACVNGCFGLPNYQRFLGGSFSGGL
jgi:hypothetical protein